MATAMRAAISPLTTANLRRNLIRSSSSSSTPIPARQRRLVLYSKPGCCLCDGLKEKLGAALSLAAAPPLNLHDVDLEVRDISENPDWENAYQYEIPVLSKLREDGSEERLPRLSPRLSVKMIQKKVAEALSQQ